MERNFSLEGLRRHSSPLSLEYNGGMSYLMCSQGKGDDSQGLQELWRPPGRILGVGAMHKAKEVQHAGREGLFPGTVSTTCLGLRTHSMRGMYGSQKIATQGDHLPETARHHIARPLRRWAATGYWSSTRKWFLTSQGLHTSFSSHNSPLR